MTNTVEKPWEWDVVAPGPVGESFTRKITPATISGYAGRVRNPNPIYLSGKVNGIAMPTSVFSSARLRRDTVAEASGYVALERLEENPRQTPFAKCTIRWFAPIHAGDTITSSSRVLEKYERRGNRFVTFRVEAINQDNIKVAEYDYSCIFEYAKGQKTA